MELGSAISYAEAAAIVLAIHGRSLSSTPELEAYVDGLDASAIRAISTIDPLAREFTVAIDHGGSGYFLSVRLQDDAVVLYELGMWTA